MGKSNRSAVMLFDWQWDYALEILPTLLAASVNTVIATVVGYSLALVVGLIFLVGQRTPFAVFNRVVREIVEFVRTTPLLAQLFFVFYVGPEYGITLSPWMSGMLTLGIHYGAYLSEVYRGALYAIPRQQWEACTALNLSPARSYLGVILPQALPASMPGINNYLVGCFKDTPVLATITVYELLNAATVMGTLKYRYLEPYTMAGIIFLILSLVSATGLRVIEHRVRRAFGAEV
jgi:polar amino acid transport system permease protein